MNDPASVAQEKKNLKDELDQWSIWANKGSKAWSFLYHLSFGAAAVLGVVVAVLSSGRTLLDGPWHDLLISIFSGFAAILTTIGGFGGFERKWRTNRRTRAELELLRIDLCDPKIDIAQIREKLKAIIRAHEAGIMGGDQPVAVSQPK